MTEIKREDIKIIARHSNWSEKSIDKVLKDHVYNDQQAWYKFLRLLFISLGVCFTTAGIIFFFAYNWADLHKFLKLGLIESLIILVTSIIVFSKLSLDIKNILLTGASMLVGVLFAVFGQIYQTGANAYDFFLGWTMFITIWVLISNFAPLWLLFITLINTTILLYWEQVAQDWSEIFVFTVLFLINTLFLAAALYGKKVREEIHAPIWFSNLLALAAVSFSTIGIVTGIFEKNQEGLLILIALTTILYGIGILYGLKNKSGFYLAIIPFSLIIIICSLIIDVDDSEEIFFLISLFVIISVTLVIKNLINLQKKWTN